MPHRTSSFRRFVAAAFAAAVLASFSSVGHAQVEPTDPPPTTSATTTTTTVASLPDDPPAPPTTDTPTTTTEPDSTEPLDTDPPTITTPTGSPTPTATSEPTAETEGPIETAPPPTEVTDTTDATETTEAPIVAFDADPTGSISVDKTNTADGSPPTDGGTVQPGDTFTYHFQLDCSSPLEDCVNYTFTETFPPEVDIDEDSLPESIPGFREVTFDDTTNTLTVRYIDPLDNPAGTGLPAGGGDSFDVTVTLPADTPLADGYEIVNEATVTANNVLEPATDQSNVFVDIPRVVEVNTTKSVTPGSMISTDPDATPVISINGTNTSSATAEVTDMVIGDTTAQTWNYFDLTDVTITSWPAGAETATLQVCPAPGPCPPAAWTVVETLTNPASDFTIPPATAANAVGVQVDFTSTTGTPIASPTTAGIDIDTDLRATVRSTGADVTTNPNTVAFDNCATTTATDTGATPPSDSADGCAPIQILPPTVNIGISKDFFADGNGNYVTDPGEHAVIGENSGVSMLINATNNSAFPINQIVITEPVAPSEFDKFDASSIRLTIPAVTSNVHVEVTYDSGPPLVVDCAPADCPNPIPVDSPPTRRVTSVTVTYTGEDADGDPTISPGSTASLGVHGNLNDLVDASDVAGSVANCANISSQTEVPGSTGSFSGNACDALPVEERNADTGGDKTSSQPEIPPDQPVLFTMRTTNNGNLPLFDVVVSDPPTGPDGVPPLTDTFRYMTFLGADIQPAAMQSRVTVEVYTPADGWQPFTPTSPPVPPQPGWENIIGVRASIDALAPTETFDLRIGMQLRDEYADDPSQVPPLSNCYNVTAGDSGNDGEVTPYTSDDYCNPPLAPQPVVESAVLNKSISPETMPRPIPGLVSAPATVQLLVQNNGTLTMQYLQATDNDTDFWDAVDFVGFGTITPPAVGALRDANQLRVDAFVAGAWVNGAVGSPSSPALPAGVAADQVRGLRFTFSDTSVLNSGFVITPCTDSPPSCAATIPFQVRPRTYLVSTGEPVPDQLLDTATGGYTTQLHPDAADPQPIPPATDDLNFVEGSHQIDVNKGPETRTVTPGNLTTFDLTARNNGTGNLPDLTVADPLPDGILFDNTFVGDGGNPYTVVWSNVPADVPAPPAPVFVETPDPAQPDRVGLVTWTFPGWDMPPNAQVVITFRYTLEPGVQAGDIITNTMGASSPVDDLLCTPPDVPVSGADTPWGGVGTYCTDPANVTVAAGANFLSRKWVAGDPDLGWYNQSTGAAVPIGGGGCLSLVHNGRTYTTNPCIALVNPGEDFHYVLRVQNGGTQPATRMTVVDTFPAPGDRSVLGTARGTQWATAPTLAGPATFDVGPSTGTITYSTSGTPCLDDLFLDPPSCAAGSWTSSTAGAAALQLVGVFDQGDLLDPGEEVRISFSMTSPVYVPFVANPTIAWNSLAHAEEYQADAQGNLAILRPIEPLRVGVATLYGNLQVVKAIGDNPAGLPLDDVVFTFSYACTISTGLQGPSGTVTATPTTPGLVTGIPSGSTCTVTETGTNGGIPTPNPVTVVIPPSVDPDTPTVTTATVTNDFPLGELNLLKAVAGFDDPDFTGGPYPVTVDCTFNGASVPGFPLVIDLTPGDEETVPAPVGSLCTVTETDDSGATTVIYDPANADGTAGLVTVPSEDGATVSMTITNDFPIGAVALLKTVTGGVDEVFTDGPYVAELTCAFNGATLPGFPDEIELDPGVPSDPVAVPVSSVCTVTETDDRGATTVTYSPARTDGTPGGEVVVPVGSDTEPISITITNDFPVGGLRVVKAIGENDADLILDDVPYTFEYQCTFDANGDDIVSPDPPGELIATVNDPAEVDGLPAGATCEVWETGTNGGIPSASEDDPAVVVIEAGTVLQPYTPVAVTNDYPTGRAELVKIVDGDAHEEFTGGPYAIAVNCWAPPEVPGAGEPYAGFPVVVVVNANEPVGTDLPVGTTCWFEEEDVPEGVTVTYDPPNADGTAGVATVPPQPPVDGFFGSVSVTNTYTTGSLVIDKTVNGPGAPAFSQGPFVFGVSCDYRGVEDVYSVAVVVPGSSDGSPVQSEPVSGLPIGASCTVTEIDNGGADIVTPPQTVTIEENEQANVSFVGVNNPYSAGSIAVTKTVAGTAASSTYVAGLRYTITVQCAVEDNGVRTTVLNRQVTVAGNGVPVTVTDASGAAVLLPLGTRCWGAEPDTRGATAVTIDANSYDNGVEVVADVDAGVQPLQINATNTFDAAALTITKRVVNPPASTATFPFTVTCSITSASGGTTNIPVDTAPIALANGQATTINVLAGARCRVTETDARGATVTIAESGGPADENPADGAVIVNVARTVTVTNTFPDTGGGGGILPDTGNAGTATIVVLASMLASAGLALLLLRRRGQRIGT